MTNLTAVDWDLPTAMVRLVTGQTIEVRTGDIVMIDPDEAIDGHYPIVSCDTMRVRPECDDRIVALMIE